MKNCIFFQNFLQEEYKNKNFEKNKFHKMIELLSKLDGFDSNDNIKFITATNRVDILDL